MTKIGGDSAATGVQRSLLELNTSFVRQAFLGNNISYYSTKIPASSVVKRQTTRNLDAPQILALGSPENTLCFNKLLLQTLHLFAYSRHQIHRRHTVHKAKHASAARSPCGTAVSHSIRKHSNLSLKGISPNHSNNARCSEILIT
jgi:hypothetical protein